MGTGTSPEERLVMKQFLLAFEQGLGKGETALFPNVIIRLKKGINMEPGDPNYDIFQLACRVTAKRMNPTYSFMDMTINKAYEDTSYMGCVDADEVVIYRKDGIVFMEGIARLHNSIKSEFGEYYVGSTICTCPTGYELYDANKGFVELKHTQCNPERDDWYLVTLSNGQTIEVTSDHRWAIVDQGDKLTEELKLGDKVQVVWDIPTTSKITKLTAKDCYQAGQVAARHYDENSVTSLAPLVFDNLLSFPEEHRIAYVAGMIDDTVVKNAGPVVWQFKSKRVALQVATLLRSIGIAATLGTYTCNKALTNLWKVEFQPNEQLAAKLRCAKIEPVKQSASKIATIVDIHKQEGVVKDSYCVTTASSYMACSLIQIGQCRTRVQANMNGPAQAEGRGNIGFVTINLPRLALKARGSEKRFYNGLDKMLGLCEEQLLHRYQTVCNLKGKDLPFVISQGLYIDSEGIGPNDSIEPAMKNGTLSVGFIGLAETMLALYGKHHGEDPEVYKKAMEVVEYIAAAVKDMGKKHHLNFTTLATPAEGLSGRFIALDRQRYGSIPGITDKGYYSNSYHLPVDYNVSIAKKLELEGPFHHLCDAGHISYVELESSPHDNPQAIEQIVLHAAKQDVGYMGINFPIDECTNCGHHGIILGNCPICGAKSETIRRIRRVTGYLSTIDRFGDGKKAELSARVSHS